MDQTEQTSILMAMSGQTNPENLTLAPHGNNKFVKCSLEDKEGVRTVKDKLSVSNTTLISNNQ